MLHGYAGETCEQGPTVAQGGFHSVGPEERRGCSVSLIMYWAPVRATPGHDPEQQILRVVSSDTHNYAAERKMCCRHNVGLSSSTKCTREFVGPWSD